MDGFRLMFMFVYVFYLLQVLCLWPNSMIPPGTVHKSNSTVDSNSYHVESIISLNFILYLSFDLL